MLEEIGQNYVQTHIAQQSARSIVNKGNFHRWFPSQYGCKTTNIITLAKSAPKRKHDFYNWHTSRPKSLNFHLALILHTQELLL